MFDRIEVGTFIKGVAISKKMKITELKPKF